MKQMIMKKMAIALAVFGLTALTANAAAKLTYYSGGEDKTKEFSLSAAEDTAAGWKYSVLGVNTLELTKSGPYTLSGNVTDLKVIVKSEECSLRLITIRVLCLSIWRCKLGNLP